MLDALLTVSDDKADRKCLEEVTKGVGAAVARAADGRRWRAGPCRLARTYLRNARWDLDLRVKCCLRVVYYGCTTYVVATEHGVPLPENVCAPLLSHVRGTAGTTFIMGPQLRRGMPRMGSQLRRERATYGFRRYR